MRIFNLFTRRGRRGNETSRVDTGDAHEPLSEVGNVMADPARLTPADAALRTFDVAEAAIEKFRHQVSLGENPGRVIQRVADQQHPDVREVARRAMGRFDESLRAGYDADEARRWAVVWSAEEAASWSNVTQRQPVRAGFADDAAGAGVPERAPEPGSWIARNLTDAPEMDTVRAALADLSVGPVTDEVLARLGVTVEQLWRLDENELPASVRTFLAEEEAAAENAAAYDERLNALYDRARADGMPVEDSTAWWAANTSPEVRARIEGSILATRARAGRHFGDDSISVSRDTVSDIFDPAAGGSGIRLDRPVPERTPEPGSWIERNLPARPTVTLPDGFEPEVLTAEEDAAEQLAYDRGEDGIAPYTGTADAAGPRPSDTPRDTEAVLDRIDELLADAVTGVPERERRAEAEAAPLAREVAECGRTVAEAEQAVQQAEITHEDRDRAERCARWAADDATQTTSEMSEGRQWA